MTLLITAICITSFIAVRLIYSDVFMTPNLELFIWELRFSLFNSYLPTRHPEKLMLYVLGSLIRQSSLRSIQTGNIPIRHETLNYSNVCTDSPLRASLSLPPPQPLTPPGHKPGLKPPALRLRLKRLQEICFTRAGFN